MSDQYGLPEITAFIRIVEDHDEAWMIDEAIIRFGKLHMTDRSPLAIEAGVLLGALKALIDSGVSVIELARRAKGDA